MAANRKAQRREGDPEDELEDVFLFLLKSVWVDFVGWDMQVAAGVVAVLLWV